MSQGNDDDDDSSASSGPRSFMGPDFPINKLTNRPFHSPYPWNADGYSGHRINTLLPNSGGIMKRPIDVAQLSIPAFPSLTQQQEASVPLKRVATNAAPAAKRRAASTATAKAAKKKREKKPLPACLQSVKVSDRDRFLHGPEDGPEDSVIEVCYAIKTDAETVELKTLNLDQLRRLCTFFGIKGAGVFNTLDCKHKLFEFSHLKHYYENLPNANQSDEQLKASTLLRLVNVAFLPDVYSRLRDINDIKKRPDYEGQSGERNPVKAFYAEMSDILNDSENNTSIGTFLPDYWNEDEPRDKDGNLVDTHTLRSLCEADDLDPSNFHPTTGKWCAVNFKDLMTARANINKAMEISGTHCDILGEYMKKKFTEVRKREHMPFAPVYYICQHCNDHPDLDATFAMFMDESLKSDSNDKDCATNNSKGSSRKKEIVDIKETLKESADGIREELAAGNQQKKEFFEAYKNEALHKQWDMEERKWQSLTNFTAKFEDTFEVNASAASLKPLSMRIQKLERELYSAGMSSMFDDSPFKGFKLPDVEEEHDKES